LIFLADTSPCRREIRYSCVGLLSSSHLTRLAPISRFVLLFVCCLILFIFFKYETIEKIHHKLSEKSTSCSMSFPREMEEEASSSYYILSCAYCVGFLWTFSAAFPPNVTTGYFLCVSILRGPSGIRLAQQRALLVNSPARSGVNVIKLDPRF
jgi:hypothetical protein